MDRTPRDAAQEGACRHSGSLGGAAGFGPLTLRMRYDRETGLAEANPDRPYGHGRQYQILAESHDLPFTHRVFRTTEEAYDWLGVDADELNDETPIDLVP